MSDAHPPRIPTPPYASAEAPGATTGLVLGICSIVLNGVPIVGLVLGILGLQKSKAARRLCEAEPRYTNAGVAQAGQVCSIIGICLSALGSLCVCAWGVLFIAALAMEGTMQGSGGF